MKELEDVGSLVESAGVVGVSCQTDSTDSGRFVVESDGSVALL